MKVLAVWGLGSLIICKLVSWLAASDFDGLLDMLVMSLKVLLEGKRKDLNDIVVCAKDGAVCGRWVSLFVCKMERGRE